MSFKAIFTINGQDLDVLSCSYSFYQSTGSDGKPTSGVLGGQIRLTTNSSVSTALVEWMVNEHKVIDGKLTYYLLDSGQVMKELSFTKGFCIGYSENFSNAGDQPMLESIVISAGSIKIGNAEHNNNWPE
jgi:hypothetical protein